MKESLRAFLDRLAEGPDLAPAVEALFDAEPRPLVVTDTEQRVVLANAPACSLLGLPAREVVGKPLMLLLRGLGSDQVEQLEEAARPIRGVSGEVSGHLNFLRRPEQPSERSEIEALRQSLIDIERTNAELRALETTRNHVLSNVSHELRTPLVTIIGYVEMIGAAELGDVPEEVSQALRVVLRNALRLSSRIDDLLNLSRLQEEELQPHAESVLVGPVISALVSEYALLFEDKEIEVQTTLPGDLPPVWADRRLASLAIENLLKNAVKFSPQRGRIRIAAAKEGDLLRVTLADEGPGIPPEHLPQVFDPFFQVDSSPTRVHGGIGLGLPIVRRIADAHGGRAALESDGRRGTTAILELPLAR